MNADYYVDPVMYTSFFILWILMGAHFSNHIFFSCLWEHQITHPAVYAILLFELSKVQISRNLCYFTLCLQVELNEGPLDQFTHEMEPFLRKQGMPVRLNKGLHFFHVSLW